MRTQPGAAWMRLPVGAAGSRRPRRARLGAAVLALALAAPFLGCAEDPFERPGTWRATGANDVNLRAQVVDPAQLQRGVGAGTDRGQQGATAITTLEAGKRPPVPTTELSGIGVTSGTSNAR